MCILSNNAKSKIINQIGRGLKKQKSPLKNKRKLKYANFKPLEYKIDPNDFPRYLINFLPQATDLIAVYRENWTAIRSYKLINRMILDIYNFRIKMRGYRKTIQNGDFLWAIFNEQKTTFKINLSFGYILENHSSENSSEYRYWHTSPNNSTYFTYAKLIKNRQDFSKLVKDFSNIDPIQALTRENYHQKITMITNITFYIYKQYHAPLGGFSCKCPLPKNILQNRAIHCFNQYSDNLCFYRCLAFNFIQNHNKKKSTLNLYTKIFQKKANTYFKNKPPIINQANLYKYEYLFKINIALYQMDDQNGVYTVYNHKKFPGRQELKLFVCYCSKHSTGHLCYIKNWSLFSKIYLCETCEVYFSNKSNLTRHKKNTACSTKPRDVFKNIIFNSQNDIFHQLGRKYECFFNNKHFNPYFACFDFEAMLATTYKTSGNQRNDQPVTIYYQKHIPVSVSIFSNVPGFDDVPKFILSSGDVANLISQFINHLQKISDKAYSLLTLERGEIFKYICRNLHMEIDAIPNKIIEKIDEIYRILPIFSFNGSNYDINIMKHHFFKHFKAPTVLKRGNSYLYIKTDKLKFLDVSNFLQAGTSYDQFLKAFNATQTKAFFPYSWLTSLDKLNETKLPSKDMFFNDLKGQPISDTDYASCLAVWRSLKMCNMKDYLRYYNNLDTIPFVECLKSMSEMYRVRGVDMFKDAISLPGISLHLLFSKCRDPYETPVNQKEHQLITDAIIGGPSIIFCRFAEVGTTFIKNHIYDNPHSCQGILGYDANSLYLSVLGKAMCSGLMCYRYLEDPDSNYLKPMKRPKKYTRELLWLMCKEIDLGVPLITSLSPGGQQKVAQTYFVDGYYRNKQTGERVICEFFGCFPHGCQICFGGNYDKKKYNETLEKIEFFKQLPGVTLHFIWDHDYDAYMRDTFDNIDITRWEYIFTILPKTLVQNKKISQKHLLKLIKQKDIFGLVRCSIYIDETYYKYYDEFPPIFKITTISKEDISGHMKEYVLKENLMSQPRQMLISTMYAENQPFITPQIEWYLKQNEAHNFEVFKIRDISEFLEFNPKKSFKPFMDNIISDRIAGDIDPNQKIQALVSKSIGNSAYGKTILNKAKLEKIYYTNERDTLKHINKPLFKDLKHLNDDLYEIRVGHKRIEWNLPRQIGVFVYGYAKLTLIRFYYDFIHKYLSFDSYEVLQIDTDSLYMALAYPTLDECVKPSMKAEFVKKKING